MKRTIALPMLVLLVGLLLAPACAPGPVPTPATTPAAAIPGKEAQKGEWEKVTAAAKKEGVVVVATFLAAPVRQAISAAMQDKFGVTIEYVSGRPAEFATKILAERRAGLYLEDMLIGGAATGLDVLKPAGVLEPLDNALVLPEVLDPKAWYAGALLWNDKGHHALSFIASPQAPIVINTTLVKHEEMKSYRNLLDPKWKGKIVMGDPTVGGSGNTIVTALGENIMGRDFLRELAKQEPLIGKDERLLGEWVARGKYPLGMAIKTEVITDFINAGAPIDVLTPQEGTYVTATTGSVLLLKNAPHPSTTKLLINWLLSKEGGTVFSKTIGAQSARVDVPTDFLHPARVRQPGAKYASTDFEEEYIKIRNEYLKTAKEIFGHLVQ
ncbi:MAG: extracellular solute-binding protein [Chloroflexi bacterium]|nr:extracellular solute-binding protein [Chloroflexota bacterium]